MISWRHLCEECGIERMVAAWDDEARQLIDREGPLYDRWVASGGPLGGKLHKRQRAT